MARVPHPIKKQHAALTYKEPFLVRAGRYGMTAGLVFIVLAVLYVGGWFATSMMLRSAIQDWFAARDAEGYIASYDESKARISGFPFTVRATVHDVILAAPKGEKGKRAWSWAPKSVAFSMTPLPWTIGTAHVDMSAKQTLSVGGKSYDGRAKTFMASFDWIANGIPEEADLEIAKARFVEKQSGREFLVDELSVELSRKSNGDYAYDINGLNVGMPLYIAGMGNSLSEVILRGTLNQNFGMQGMDPLALGQWRDNGGTLEATRVQLGYGPLLIQGNGTMALDGDLQPVGAFSARIQGFFKAIDRLSRVGVVRGPDASMAKVVLGMLSKQPKNGGAATISLPLTIQDRGLYAGPVRLIEIPQIHW